MRKFFLVLFFLFQMAFVFSASPKKALSDYYQIQQERGVTVEGIYICKSRRVALINGNYYVVEDMIPGRGELVAILKDRVVISEESGLEVYQMLKHNTSSRT